jgi:hypothetical protein
MRPPIRVLTCLTLAKVCLYGQAAYAPSFEVASLKPASPSASGISCSGGPGTASPGIWRCSNVPLLFFGLPILRLPSVSVRSHGALLPG